MSCLSSDISIVKRDKRLVSFVIMYTNTRAIDCYSNYKNRFISHYTALKKKYFFLTKKCQKYNFLKNWWEKVRKSNFNSGTPPYSSLVRGTTRSIHFLNAFLFNWAGLLPEHEKVWQNLSSERSNFDYSFLMISQWGMVGYSYIWWQIISTQQILSNDTNYRLISHF